MNRSLARDYRQGLTGGFEAFILGLSVFAPQVFMAAGFALLAAGLAFFSWMSCYRRSRAIADTPTSRIASAAQGYVELSGRLRPLSGRELHAPLSGESCVWYRFREDRYNGSRWDLAGEGESDAPFMIEDGSGACLVRPQGAEMTGLEAQTWYNDNRGDAGWRKLSRDDRRRTEWLLREGEEAHVVGRFATLSGTSLELFLNAQAAPEGLAERFDLDGSGEVDAGEWELARSQARRETRRAFGDPPERHVIERPADGRPFLLRRGEEGETAGRASYRRWALFHSVIFLAALGSLPHALSKPWGL